MSKNAYVIEALSRGLHVLSLFSRERAALSLTDIQKTTGMKKTTAFRVLSTLEEAGYLQRDSQTKLYRPGLKVLQLGFTAISGLELRHVARPHLEALAAHTGETVSLSVLDGLEAVYVDRLRNYQSIVGVVLGLGSRIPANCSSMGKVMLAHLLPEELDDRLASASLTACTPHSLVDRDAFLETLARVREQGYALNLEELEIGLRATAAPIFNHEESTVAAINISGSIRTISRERLTVELVPNVVKTAAQISQALGYVLPGAGTGESAIA